MVCRLSHNADMLRDASRMDDFAAVHEMAALWNLSVRQVQKMCAVNMIPGIVRFGNARAIPKTARKATRTNRTEPGPSRCQTERRQEGNI
jgi:hypothetical protein